MVKPVMNKYALLVGIDEYDDATIRPLMCAENDARKLEGFLRYRCGFTEARALLGKQATSASIVKTAAQFGEQMNGDDLFLLFFAGHGLEHQQHGHLLLLHGAQRQVLDAFPQRRCR